MLNVTRDRSRTIAGGDYVYSDMTVTRPTELQVEQRLRGNLEAFFDDELDAMGIFGVPISSNGATPDGYGNTPDATHRYCYACKCKLPLSRFEKNPKRLHGIGYYCKKHAGITWLDLMRDTSVKAKPKRSKKSKGKKKRKG